MATKVIDKMVTEGDLYSNISIICKGVSSLKVSPRLLRIWQGDTDRSPPSLYSRPSLSKYKGIPPSPLITPPPDDKSEAPPPITS